MSQPGYFEVVHHGRHYTHWTGTYKPTSAQRRKDRRNQRKAAATAMLSSTRKKLEKEARNG